MITFFGWLVAKFFSRFYRSLYAASAREYPMNAIANDILKYCWAKSLWQMRQISLHSNFLRISHVTPNNGVFSNVHFRIIETRFTCYYFHLFIGSRFARKSNLVLALSNPLVIVRSDEWTFFASKGRITFDLLNPAILYSLYRPEQRSWRIFVTFSIFYVFLSLPSWNVEKKIFFFAH